MSENKEETKDEPLPMVIPPMRVSRRKRQRARWVYHEGDLWEEQALQATLHEEDQEWSNAQYASLFVAVHEVTLRHTRGLAAEIAQLIVPFLAPSCGCYSPDWFFAMQNDRHEETLIHRMSVYRYRGPHNQYPRFNEILRSSLSAFQHTHVYPPLVGSDVESAFDSSNEGDDYNHSDDAVVYDELGNVFAWPWASLRDFYLDIQ